jgi:hypothetical protein
MRRVVGQDIYSYLGHLTRKTFPRSRRRKIRVWPDQLP